MIIELEIPSIILHSLGGTSKTSSEDRSSLSAMFAQAFDKTITGFQTKLVIR